MKRALPFQPVPGDIVFCKFPEALEATCPGPKIRPALVVDVSKDGNRVYVAYGTSQRTEQLYPGEFRVDDAASMEMAGLCKPTKFALCRKHWLALNEEWFVVPHKRRFGQCPKMGELSESLAPHMARAVETMRAARF